MSFCQPAPQGKRCSKCGEVKPLTEFYRDARAKDGRRPHCKACITARCQANKEARAAYDHARYEANREEILAQARVYREDHKDERAAYGRAYRDANKEKIAARCRVYRETHKKEAAAWSRVYAKTPRGRAVRLAADMRRRQLPNVSDLSAAMIQEVTDASGGICPYCGESFEDGHVDHVIPVSRGGGNDRANLRYVCTACNLSKGAKTLEEWLR